MLKILTPLLLILLYSVFLYPEQVNSFVSIDARIEPNTINIGEEGVLNIRVKPSMAVNISSTPEFVIRLNESDNGIVFTKNFFTASELEFKTKQVGDNVFLDLEKEIIIPFTINNAYPGLHKISGKIIFTAVDKKDNWSVKTFHTFSVFFKSEIKKVRKKNKRKKRKK